MIRRAGIFCFKSCCVHLKDTGNNYSVGIWLNWNKLYNNSVNIESLNRKSDRKKCFISNLDILKTERQCSTMAMVPATQIASPGSHNNPKMKQIPDILIDTGKFKYVLIKVHDPDKTEREFKHIVRGAAKACYHGKY